MSKYTNEERRKAVELLIKYGLSIHAVRCELGYPSRTMLYQWYKEYQETGDFEKERRPNKKYSSEQRRIAVEYYVEHGRSISRTLRALGYPSKTRLSEWLNEDLPKNLWRWNCKSDNSAAKYTQEQKEKIVTAYCVKQYTPKQITETYGVCPGTLYTWKKQLLGQEKNRAMPKTAREHFAHESYPSEETIDNLRLEKKALEQQVHELEKDIYKLQLERDVNNAARAALARSISRTVTNDSRT